MPIWMLERGEKRLWSRWLNCLVIVPVVVVGGAMGSRVRTLLPVQVLEGRE
jgi:hypothetical protein